MCERVSVTADGGNHIFLNELSGELSLGRGGIDYEDDDRMFSLSVRAVDNPDGPASDRLTVSHIHRLWFVSFTIFSPLLFSLRTASPRQ